MAGNPEIEDCVTIAQFNELKRSMEEKQDQLSQDIQALMAQLRNLNNIPEAASNLDETDEEVAARLARQQQQRQLQSKLLLMLGGLWCKVVGMVVIVLAVEEEEVVEIEEVNMMFPIMRTKEMILNSSEIMTISIKGVMHVIEEMKRGLANLNLQCLNLMVGLIQKLISHGS
jgi:hypothetical protein